MTARCCGSNRLSESTPVNILRQRARKAFFVSPRELRRLRTLAERAQAADDYEVCGLLLSKGRRTLELLYLPNRASNPGQWLIHTLDIRPRRIMAEKSEREIVGTFHSHPAGDAIPGERDVASAWPGSLMLIYDVCGLEARLWRFGLPKRAHPPLGAIAPQETVSRRR